MPYTGPFFVPSVFCGQRIPPVRNIAARDRHLRQDRRIGEASRKARGYAEEPDTALSGRTSPRDALGENLGQSARIRAGSAAEQELRAGKGSPETPDARPGTVLLFLVTPVTAVTAGFVVPSQSRYEESRRIGRPYRPNNPRRRHKRVTAVTTVTDATLVSRSKEVAPSSRRTREQVRSGSIGHKILGISLPWLSGLGILCPQNRECPRLKAARSSSAYRLSETWSPSWTSFPSATIPSRTSITLLCATVVVRLKPSKRRKTAAGTSSRPIP